MRSELEGLVEQYLAERQDLAASTVPNVRWALLSFVAHLDDDTGAGGISSEDLAQWMASQRCGRGTARNRYSAVKLFCHWLIRKGRLQADPTLHLKSPRQPRAVPRGLPAEAVRHLVTTLPDSRAMLIVVWMVQLGLRAVELTRLEVGDIDPESRRLPSTGKRGASDDKTDKPADVSYKSCDEVRAAGKAPLKRDQPGYSTKLDRDGDGVACD